LVSRALLREGVGVAQLKFLTLSNASFARN
jgi:hypothetical protein